LGLLPILAWTIATIRGTIAIVRKGDDGECTDESECSDGNKRMDNSNGAENNDCVFGRYWVLPCGCRCY